ncbi:MAG: bifunctional N-acetylglucosamine-1-phosphate uridyltransferase/glucosamine-1-phosphate acetyltransferase [Candidatus Omnitrophota bacterium]|jgi:bifunctional UDP-N-acetylglucosamine pyrophosphorylase/glucosamine-1-phosphate N-acetyltransferase|nr:MAG: bifunctional N-acetylglucosamine-1-phosphate uridyltransferase/glucosamine-1-phosphate acetyltransferase [Candidatus Omnitrophota bacterium]
MKKKEWIAIILAAGQGTRMKSGIPKVLHSVCGRPMLAYVLDSVQGLAFKKIIAVVGYKSGQVEQALPSGTTVVKQGKLLGTGDAVKKALNAARGFKGSVLVLYGDNPLLQKETIKKLMQRHTQAKACATLLVAKVEKPEGYGRILRDKYQSIYGIIEDKDADDFQKEIKEVNTGIVCFKASLLAAALVTIRPGNAKKEYYLTDCIEALYKKRQVIEHQLLADIQEGLGINSRLDLAKANKIMQKRINERLMEAGVTIIDPENTLISYGTVIGPDTVIYPFTAIEKNVKIGKRCLIGPFIHVREGTVLEDGVQVGNFLEISRAKIASGSTAKHFGYLGDVKIGKGANIGAGTVTANFDGRNKHTTIIKDKAFIGSDTVLVAPVTVGRGSKTGAGSVVTKLHNVRDGVTVVGIPARPLPKKGRKK